MSNAASMGAVEQRSLLLAAEYYNIVYLLAIEPKLELRTKLEFLNW